MTQWSKEQRANANLIIRVGQEMGMQQRDIAIALATAMQESSLRNLTWGDRDSAGLFQQRPSQGWGSFDQVTDARYATRKFYESLAGVADRGSMSLAEAAQAVQRSAYPDAYAKWEKDAYGFLGDGADLIAPGSVPVESAEDVLASGGSLPQPATAFAAPDPMGASSAPGLAATTEPVQWMPSGMTPFGSPDEYAALAQGAQYGQPGVDLTGNAVVDLAMTFQGVPYVWGGTDPNGFDCSGLVQYVYAQMGIDLPRVSFQQAAATDRVSLDELRPGDLVFWDNSPRNNGADHVAIYMGQGKIIEAPRPGASVRVRDLRPDEGAWGGRVRRRN